ncbi:thioredoxin family protein [Mycoplasmopsis iners]|uniref:thioredoxin family protein n=1 Tax=Mycoplasmopsis iners TaxID=76630 RepID=UPI0006925CF9|nr:thioredoxin family protein [Mycoplasmopsis iners]
MKKVKYEKMLEIIASPEHKNKLFFLEFSTTWCGDCKMMEPIVKKVVNDNKNNKDTIFLEIDAEEAQLFRDPLSKWQVFKVPTFVYLKNNEILKTLYEYYPSEILQKFLDDYSN